MDENNMKEFERRIRFEAEIGKDVQHIRDDFDDHLEGEKAYKIKFDKVQESHNNILNRVNNVEDDISDIEDNISEFKKELKNDNDKINSIDKDLFKHKIAFFAVFALLTGLILICGNEIIQSAVQNVFKIIIKIF